ncbi:hypothetical protein F53441_1992 [Fusarium austroafricanum]|uniref:Uncharacterized protein n=1 Tax=Fusarium austroafricanum TaxID=2364996 RepID=A0A8H4P3G0_9HYPO|nr:hypothetical protein F53441_1992 [Fusarium austroafricanum]
MDLLESDEVDSEFFDDLRQRVEITLADLEDWEQFNQYPRPLASYPSPTASAPVFHTVRDKSLLALQRAIILCMSGLCALLKIPLVAEIPAVLENRHAVKTAIASEICELATSCVGHTHSTEPLLFIFPLQIASMNFETGSQEEKMAEEIMNGVIADTHGFEIGRRREWKTSSVILVK